MSDTFDHELDAYESMDDMFGPERPKSSDSRPYHSGADSHFSPDPLYYHTKIGFTELTNEVSNAYLIDGRWIPKRICKELNLDNKTVWVHTKIYESIMDKPPVPKLDDEPF